MSDERKTLEQRHQMSDIERLRHSAAHVLATAILRIWPEAQFAAGPPVENGFYYDLDLPHRISTDDFARIEEEMKKEIKANHVFEKTIVSRAEAIALAENGRLGGLGERPGNVSKFKIGNLQDIPEGEDISLFKNGDFLDLCAGPHVMRTGNIGAFRLTHVASAYYKGDEKNPQLQRIYGTAFKNKTEMEAYFTMLEEAKKRDHRKLGREPEGEVAGVVLDEEADEALVRAKRRAVDAKRRGLGVLAGFIDETEARGDGEIDLVGGEGELLADDIPNLDVDLRPVERTFVGHFDKRRAAGDEDIADHLLGLDPQLGVIDEFLPEFLRVVGAEAELVTVDAEDREILQIHLVHGVELGRELLLGAVNVGVIHLHGAHAHQAEEFSALLVAVTRPILREPQG